MLLRMSTWDKIREQFTEDEKSLLNRAIVGEVICPRGCQIQEEVLPAELLRKLVRESMKVTDAPHA